MLLTMGKTMGTFEIGYETSALRSLAMICSALWRFFGMVLPFLSAIRGRIF
jgi:hypothetical protein